jgi:hypothetical protein
VFGEDNVVSAGQSTDAYEGEYAVLVENFFFGVDFRDTGLDRWDTRIPVGEGWHLKISWASKLVWETYEVEPTELQFKLACFRADGSHISDYIKETYTVGMAAYETFLIEWDVLPDVAFVNPAFRIRGEEARSFGYGGYLIDAVSIIPEPGTFCCWSALWYPSAVAGAAGRKGYRGSKAA